MRAGEGRGVTGPEKRDVTGPEGGDVTGWEGKGEFVREGMPNWCGVINYCWVNCRCLRWPGCVRKMMS